MNPIFSPQLSKRQQALHQGKNAEELACQWFLLQHLGSRCIERNYWVRGGRQKRGGEIDLIFECPRGEGIELIFAEVKYRAEKSWVAASESLGSVKLLRLKRAILYYLSRYRGKATCISIQLLSFDGQKWEMRAVPFDSC